MTQLAAEPVVEHGTPIDDSLSACTSEADAKSLLIERSALKSRSMLPKSLWDSTHVSVFFLAATQNPTSLSHFLKEESAVVIAEICLLEAMYH